ncbi:hypothetical protein [Actinoalloteichus hymeniacidonis]|uniref:Uncharacterized protein n=1 Tax=Actinoalloteichus hymeniacidonis TaxID=340345 RepID=A0AAC9HSS3_9PSEU|nr:hypothetical protein [Actinoalloteichus hymeniacidonis]AOS65007.1 hypothetical protein TL08_21085 [Actinoalloteichus hymeniacidonis]MBB5906916.1 hypothetical protein [Actinoalloteichus hymeniacidonis]
MRNSTLVLTCFDHAEAAAGIASRRGTDRDAARVWLRVAGLWSRTAELAARTSNRRAVAHLRTAVGLLDDVSEVQQLDQAAAHLDLAATAHRLGIDLGIEAPEDKPAAEQVTAA